jgi:RNA polymerase sigma-70 factor (ECF subfamily)
VIAPEPRHRCGEDEGVEEEPDAAVIVASLDAPLGFGVICDLHAAGLHRYLGRRLGPDDADSMVGEVFRIAFEKRSSYDPSRASARPWLYGIATNLLAKHRRREARRIQATARLAARDRAAGDFTERADDSIDAAERWARVAAAVTALPEGERDALLLWVWEGLAYDEIADALAIPVGTVRSRLNRARGRLRELGGFGEGERDERSAARRAGRIGS